VLVTTGVVALKIGVHNRRVRERVRVCMRMSLQGETGPAGADDITAIDRKNQLTS
jgi:hypothetical protein